MTTSWTAGQRDDPIGGGRGDDRLAGGEGDDALISGPGIDTADYISGANRGMNISLGTVATSWRDSDGADDDTPGRALDAGSFSSLLGMDRDTVSVALGQ